MAKGDVVSNITDVAAAASLIYQPAAGVEVLITEVGSSGWTGPTPDKTPYVTVRLNNGTSISVLKLFNESTTWSKELKAFITNSVYLDLYNPHTGTASIGYCGIQIK